MVYNFFRSDFEWYVFIPVYFVAMALGKIIHEALDRIIGFVIGGKPLETILKERKNKEARDKPEKDKLKPF